VTFPGAGVTDQTQGLTITTLIFAAYVVTITGSTDSLVAIGGMVKEVISAFIRA